ncbi:hypothetical protein G9P44_004556 [Scheffersomyces stipitis]|nr:hypothetical protein G9P44_004556 [Scheffersomyces stipitis]
MSSTDPDFNWLEVQTASSNSVPTSFHYQYLNDLNNSMDTFSMFNRLSGNNTLPTFANTSHLSPSPKKSTRNGTFLSDNSSDKNVKGDSSPGANSNEFGTIKDHDSIVTPQRSSGFISGRNEPSFNQVPQRFSSFILDQQMSQSKSLLDSFSVISPSENSEDDLLGRKFSSSKKNRTLGSKTRTRPANAFRNSLDLSREFSDYAGSHAGTIFSTRAESQILLQGPQVPLQPRSRFSGFRKLRNSKKYKVKVEPQATLMRSNAIKDPEGSIFYRMKIRLKKWLSKIKNLKFHNFIASSKRTGSIRRSNTLGRSNTLIRSSTLNRSKSKALRRKYRDHPNNRQVQRALSMQRPKISVPLNNPNLGQRPVQTVLGLDDELKFQAGAPEDNINISFRKESEGKMNHLASYINEQQNQYFKVLDPRRKSINYGKHPSGNVPTKLDEIIPEFSDSKLEDEKSDVESEAPPPPPHVQGIVAPVIVDDNAVALEIWRRYLAHVLSKRIMLRQEINIFRNLLENKSINSEPVFAAEEGVEPETEISETESRLPLASEEASFKEISLSDMVSQTNTNLSSSSEERSDTPTIIASQGRDSNPSMEEEEFHNQLNRRSILGEMLEYESDGESVASSSVYSLSSISESIASRSLSKRSASTYGNSSEPLTRTYGTIIRRHTLKPESSGRGPMRRSHGIQHSLTELKV